MAKRTPTNAPDAAAVRPESDRLITMDGVRARAELSRTTIYKLMLDGDFPRPVPIGGRRLWSEHEINAWIADRKAARVATVG
jgi:prophage regulatory protein